VAAAAAGAPRAEAAEARTSLRVLCGAIVLFARILWEISLRLYRVADPSRASRTRAFDGDVVSSFAPRAILSAVFGVASRRRPTSRALLRARTRLSPLLLALLLFALLLLALLLLRRCAIRRPRWPSRRVRRRTTNGALAEQK